VTGPVTKADTYAETEAGTETLRQKNRQTSIHKQRQAYTQTTTKT